MRRRLLLLVITGAALAGATAVAAPITLTEGPGSPYTFAGAGTSAASSLAVGYLNSDLRFDAATGRNGSELRSFLSPGNTSPDPFAVARLTPDNGGRVFIADADADGKFDVLTFTQGQDEERTYLNGGSGSFTAQPVTAVAGRAAVVGNFTADVLPDAVVVQGLNIRTQELVAGSANGRFAGAQTAIVSDADSDPAVQAAGDVDGDSDLDVVGVRSGFVRVLRNNGAGTFTPLAAVAIGTGAPLAVQVADVDEDGKGDPVVLTANGTVTVLRSTGTAVTLASGLAAGTVAGLAVADLDGDDNLDLVLGGQATTGLRTAAGNGDGTFAAAAAPGIPAAAEISAVAAGDLSGDRKPDVAVIAGPNQDVHLLTNTTPWTPRATTSAGQPTSSITATVTGTADSRGGANPRVSVEYGTTLAYGSTTPEQAFQPFIRDVSVELTGLAPSTTYHARLRTTTDDGTAIGGDVMFTTAASGTPTPTPTPSQTTTATATATATDTPAPTAAAGPTAVLAPPGDLVPPGIEVPFDASFSSGTGLRFAWDVDGAGAFAIDTGTTPILKRAFDGAGPHRVQVRVTDAAGRTDVAEATIGVPDPTGLRLTTTTTGVPVDKPVAAVTRRTGTTRRALRQAAAAGDPAYDQYRISGDRTTETTVKLPGAGTRVILRGEVAEAGEAAKLRYPKPGAYLMTADAGALSGTEGLSFVTGITVGPDGAGRRRTRYSFPPNPGGYSAPKTESSSRWTVGFAYDTAPALGQNRTFYDTSRYFKKGEPVIIGGHDDRPHSLVWDWGDGSETTITDHGQPATHRWAKLGTYTVTVELFDSAINKVVPQGTLTMPITVGAGDAICSSFTNPKGVAISLFLNRCLFKASPTSGIYTIPDDKIGINGVLVTGTGLLLTNDRTRLIGSNLTLNGPFGALHLPPYTHIDLSTLASIELPPGTLGPVALGASTLSIGVPDPGPKLRAVVPLPAPLKGSVETTYFLRKGTTSQKTDTGGGAADNRLSYSFLDFANFTVTNRADGATTIGGDASFGPFELDVKDTYDQRAGVPGTSQLFPRGVWLGPPSNPFRAVGAVLTAPIPVFPGVLLTKVGLEGGTGTIENLGGFGRLETEGNVAGRTLVSIEGCVVAYRVTTTLPPATAAPKCQENIALPTETVGNAPSGVRLGGKAAIMGIDVGRAGVGVYPTHMTIEGALNVPILPYDILNLNVNTGFAVYGLNRFHAQLKAEACSTIPVLGRTCSKVSDFVFTSRGVGTCINLKLVSPGFWYRWGQALSLRAIWDQVYLRGCTVQKVSRAIGVSARSAREALTAPPGTTSAIGATMTGLSVKVAKRADETVFKAFGAGAAPSFRVIGPKGDVIADPTADPDKVFLANPPAQMTTALLRDVAPGTYRLEPLDGSAALTEASLQQTIPLATVRGKVVRTRGGGYALDYVAPRLPGQKVVLQEFRGKEDLGFLPSFPAAKGRLMFTPRPGPGGTRTIRARVEQDGRPITDYKLATYAAPAMKPVKPVTKVSVRGGKTALLVSWRGVKGARAYRVRVTTSERQTTTRVVGGKVGRITVPTLHAGAGATATIVTQAADYRESKPATGKLKARKRPKPRPVRV